MSLRTLLTLFVFALACLTAVHPASAEERWLMVSDIHLNPFDTSSRPVYYEKDSNLALLDSSIAAMRRAEPNPPVILLLGDFLAHHFDRLSAEHHRAVSDVALTTMQLIASRFNRAFPHARFIIVIGNNDDPCGDYHASYGSAYVRRLASIWSPLVNRAGSDPDFLRTFVPGGYYTENYGKLRFVALNSVYWSFRYKNACSPGAVDPSAAELLWLKATLAATPSSEKNIVVMHIPPGVDSGSTSVVHGIATVPFLSGRANAQLTASIDDPVNALVLAGHTHHTEVRIIGSVPMLIVASISPIYGNSPTFFDLAISPDTGTVRDFDAYMYRYGDGDPHQRIGVPGWERVFDYDTAFGVTSADATAFRAVHARLQSGWRPTPAAQFEANRYSICAQDERATNFATCAGINRRDWLLISLLSVGGLLLALVIYAIIRWR